MQGLSSLLAAFEPVGLAQMQDVSLLKRVDTKFLLQPAQVAVVLANVVDDYHVLDIEQRRLNRYQTLYFDTPNFDLYRLHHAGARHRYKVRSRQYIDSQLAFFEVKHKSQEARTEKERLPTTQFITRCNAETNRFIANHMPFAMSLEPTVSNWFSRMTLVSKHGCERVTLDVCLRFGAHGRGLSCPNIVIAEVKQEQLDHRSYFMQQMRALSIRPASFSKYCIGVALLYPHIKHNRFKPNLRLLNKLSRGVSYV